MKKLEWKEGDFKEFFYVFLTSINKFIPVQCLLNLLLFWLKYRLMYQI